MPAWLWVGLGGFLGSVLRYQAGVMAQRFAPASQLPWGTLLVNVSGSLMIGILGALAGSRGLISAEGRLLLLVGLLGGFTTFSALSFETLQFMHRGQWHLAGGNLLAQVGLGLLAVWMGFSLSRSLITMI